MSQRTRFWQSCMCHDKARYRSRFDNKRVEWLGGDFLKLKISLAFSSVTNGPTELQQHILLHGINQ